MYRSHFVWFTILTQTSSSFKEVIFSGVSSLSLEIQYILRANIDEERKNKHWHKIPERPYWSHIITNTVATYLVSRSSESLISAILDLKSSMSTSLS